MPIATRLRMYYAITLLWVLLTVSLASWWLVFALDQAEQLSQLGGPRAVRLSEVQHMLAWEGTALIGLLVAAGVSLMIGVAREQTRQRAIESFFTAFTHDLRTSIAGVQLQAESLREDLPAAADHPTLNRLLNDARRLQLQLENSLYFAQPDGRLLVETIDLAECLARTAADWPELTCQLDGRAFVRADVRVLQTVFRNVLQNAVVHGGATALDVTLRHHADAPPRRRPAHRARVAITMTDNGRGAPASALTAAGRPFSHAPADAIAPPGAASPDGPPNLASPAAHGTGVGLFVSRRLVRRMDGDLSWRATGGPGFSVVLDLPDAEATTT